MLAGLLGQDTLGHVAAPARLKSWDPSSRHRLFT